MNVIITLLKSLVITSNLVSSDYLVEEIKPRQLYPYRGLQNAQIFVVQAPDFASRLVASFAANITQGCDHSNVTLFMRQGGLPIANLNNYSYPINAVVDRTSDFELFFESDGGYRNVSIDTPHFGEIYITGFILDPTDRIQQEGLVRSCTTLMWGKIEVYPLARNVFDENQPAENNTVNLIRHNFPDSLVVQWTVLRIDQTNTSLMIAAGKKGILAWSVISPYDLGGTLKIQLRMNTSGKTSSNLTCCIQPPNEQVHCSSLSNGNISSVSYYPYPVAGSWHLLLEASLPEDNTTDSEVGLLVDVSLKPCFDSACGEHGRCKQYISSGIVYSACVCSNGYNGLACTDGSEAVRDSVLLASVWLLTLSNLFFIPALVIAFKRQFYPQCMIYTATMLFSTFYHACDQEAYSFCLLPYSVLQFGDFFGALSSVWLTSIAASQLQVRNQWRETIVLTGIVIIALAVHADATSFAAFLIPIIGGLVFIAVSWILRSYKEGQCYPGTKYGLRSVLPCAVFALTGLVCFAFLETESNYFYVHSIWHMCIALAIVCIMPRQAESICKC